MLLPGWGVKSDHEKNRTVVKVGRCRGNKCGSRMHQQSSVLTEEAFREDAPRKSSDWKVQAKFSLALHEIVECQETGDKIIAAFIHTGLALDSSQG